MRWQHHMMHACDVSDIVGAPYNVFSIKATDWDDATNPITGGTQLTVTGKGFFIYCRCQICVSKRSHWSYGWSQRQWSDNLLSAWLLILQFWRASSYYLQNLTQQIYEQCFAVQLFLGDWCKPKNWTRHQNSFFDPNQRRDITRRVCGMDKFTIKIMQLGCVSESIVNFDSHTNNILGGLCE